MFGNLRPWIENDIKTDEYYNPLISSLKQTQFEFRSNYELSFIRHFSSKTQYYKKLIDNDIVQYCNTLFSETNAVSNELIAFKINKSNKALHSLIKQLSDIIKTQAFDLSIIISRHTDYSIDTKHKESTFIIHYLLSALIRCCMEIQTHFNSHIHEDKRMVISDYYTRFLKQQAPSNTYLSEITLLHIDEVPTITQKTIDVDFTTQVLSTKYQSFIDTVALYQFLALPKIVALNNEGQNELVYAIINNDVPYSVAMLFHLGYIENLKKNYSLSKEQSYSHLVLALNSNNRTIKGNCLVIQNPNSKEDKYKYPAENFIEEVQKNYNSILLKYPYS